MGTVKVTTAIKLDSKIKSKIEEMFKGDNIEYIVDKKIIGGIKIKSEDNIYDSSIKYFLDDLKLKIYKKVEN